MAKAISDPRGFAFLVAEKNNECVDMLQFSGHVENFISFQIDLSKETRIISSSCFSDTLRTNTLFYPEKMVMITYTFYSLATLWIVLLLCFDATGALPAMNATQSYASLL